MCGIFGIVGLGPITGAELVAMSRLQRHRGPDDEGYFCTGPTGTFSLGGDDTPLAVIESGVPYAPYRLLDGEGPLRAGGVALGHRRLAILDLSANGHQPMSYRGRYWIVFNGEVYNYRELRSELEARGHRFSTATDTEVVLAAYAEWGSGCLSRFNGMWSLGILDLECGTLFFARDRFGVKPLYYWIDGGRLAFASEVKAFSALVGWRAVANMPRLLDFLIWNVMDHSAETMFRGVHQLPAGHFVLLNVSDALRSGAAITAMAVRPERWYSIRPSDVESPRSAPERLREALFDSVRLRLRADVTVGSCLSGGIDSSSIVAIMGKLLAEIGTTAPMKTVTAASTDRAFDESTYARIAADRARAAAVFVLPEPDRLFDDLSRLVWHQDEPFLSSSIFAQWCVFEAARREGIIVMLDGQGADETLCGYRGFFGAYLAGLVRAGRLLAWVSESRALGREIGFSWLRLFGYTAAYLAPGILSYIGRLDRREYADRNWMHPQQANAFSQDPVLARGGRAASVRTMSLSQIMATNLPMLLHWEDRNSMAFSVEARVPFLDYRVVELSLGLPDVEKLGRGISKGVLRRAMRGIVPDVVLDRRDKLGFVTAEPLWMRRDHSARFRKELSKAIDALPGVLSPQLLSRFDDVVRGQRPFDFRYWRALSAGRWVAAFSVVV